MDSELSVRIVEDDADFQALEGEWNALWSACKGARLSQGFSWCRTAWTVCNAPFGRSLYLVTARRGSRLVGIWPLVRQPSRRGGLGDTATLLSRPGYSFSLVLIDPSETGAAVVDAMIAGIGHDRRVSVVEAPWTPDSSDLARSLGGRPGLFRRGEMRMSWVDWSDVDDYDAYLRRNLSGKHLGNYRRLRRKLSERGDLRFVDVTEPEALRRGNAWLYRTKIAWMEDQKGHVRTEMDQVAEDFAATYAATGSDAANFKLYLLELDGKPVSGVQASIGNQIYELNIITYDPEYSEYSAGRLAVEECVRMAYEMKMPVDMRVGYESWKNDWTNREGLAVSFELLLDWRGHVRYRASRIRTRLGEARDRVLARMRRMPVEP